MPAKSNRAADTNHSDLPNLKTSQGDRIFPNRVALFFLLATIGLILDLWTKSYMFAHYFDPALEAVHQPQLKHFWIEGVFGIQTSTNPGALFGWGKGLSWLFASLSIVALAGIILWLFVWRAATDRLLTISLGMISGGILGNFYDRVGWGYVDSYPPEIRTNVRDWIYFHLENVPMFNPWPNFNIADSLLVCGALLLLAHAIFWAEPDDKSEAETENNDPK